MITDVLQIVSSWTFLILIVGGIFSSLYFLERISAVFSEELQEWVKYVAYFGFIVGIIVLINTASNLVLPHLNDVTITDLGKQVGWDVTILGFVLGITLCLRPIKDYRWAAIITLTMGCALMILIWLLAPSSVDQVLIILVIGFLFVFYMSLKFIEDIYSLLGDILTAPPIAVGIGIIAIVEGILLLFNSSLITLIGL